MNFLKITFIFLILFIFANQAVFAQETPYKTKHMVEYELNIENKKTINTKVIHKVNIIFNNQKEGLKEVIFKEPVKKIKNLRLLQNEKEQEISQEGSSIIITFKNPIVGKKIEREVKYEYTTPKIFKRIGTTYLLDIPKVEKNESIDDFTLRIILNPQTEFYVLKNLGTLKEENNKRFLEFSYTELKESGNFVILGNEMFYKIKIKYLIDSKKNNFVVLPNIEGRQESFITEISEEPKYISKDYDGNTIFTYPKTEKTKIIEISYLVRVFGNKTPVKNKGRLKTYIKPTKYWDFNKGLPNYYLTSFKIGTTKKEKVSNAYKYVKEYLEYDYKKTNYDFINRIGSENLNDDNKNNAVCLEYSDLLISLLRGMNIPTRELSGIALIEEEEQNTPQMHSWVDYEDNGFWKQVDPTWADTANQDYLNNFDLYHITFLIRGKNSEYPLLPGSYANNKSNEVVDIKILSEIPAKQEVEIQKTILFGMKLYKNPNINYINNIKPYGISMKLSKNTSKFYRVRKVEVPLNTVIPRVLYLLIITPTIGILIFIFFHKRLKGKAEPRKRRVNTIK